jgi:hypothetical protein
MRIWIQALALLATGTAHAADICPTLRSQLWSADPATRVAAVACNEYMIWYRPFIDLDGRYAGSRCTTTSWTASPPR